MTDLEELASIFRRRRLLLGNLPLHPAVLLERHDARHERGDGQGHASKRGGAQAEGGPPQREDRVGVGLAVVWRGCVE